MSIDYKKEVVIDRRSIKPIHEQLTKQLEKLLSSARVINDEQLISSETLANLLNIDVEDVRKAYRRLEKENFIRISSDGVPLAFKYNRILGFFDSLMFIEDGIRSLNKEPSVDLIDFKIVTIDDSSLIQMNQFKDSRFLKQVRLFRADGEPYIYLEEYYSLERFPKLIEIDATYAGKVYQGFLSKHYDIIFKKNQRLVNVYNFDQHFANVMKIEKGLPGFKVDMIYFDQYDKPFGYSRSISLPHFYFEYEIKF